MFAEKNLKVENYMVEVGEGGNKVTVSLSLDPPQGALGSTGKFPVYWVTFSKKTGKILNKAYTP